MFLIYRLLLLTNTLFRITFSIARFIQTIHPPNCYMTSFDINNLFTNIPFSERCYIILSSKIHESLNIPHSNFKQLLSLSANNSIFTFNNKYYNQMQMGSPMDPTFENIFLCFHEIEWINQYRASFRPLIYKRFVDECFFNIQNKSESDPFFVAQSCPSINFLNITFISKFHILEPFHSWSTKKFVFFYFSTHHK